MDFVITFIEGVITFVSPCLLPMLPIYIAYFAGDVETGTKRSPGHTAASIAGFIIGFTAVFTLLGALAGTVGSFFASYRRPLEIACGIVVVVLGLNYLGILRIPILQRTLKPKSNVVPRGFASSLLFGIVFAVGWTPCVGAFLGSALSMAASSAHTATGVGLLLCYSLGLALPFAVSAVLIDQLEGAFSWVKKHYAVINGICGALLVVVGILMASGQFGIWLGALSVR